MLTVSEHIKNLLHEHDCIIIPEFGGIIASYESAQIDSINTFAPPSKRVAFNESLQKSDGLLVNEITIEDGCSREEADQFINDFIKEIYNTIEEDGFYILEGIGKFFTDDEKNLQFDPYNEINFLDDSYGLTELYFKPIERDTDMKRVPPNQPRPAVRRPPVRRETPAAAKKVEKNEAKGSKKPKEPKEPNANAGKMVYLLIPAVLFLLAGGLFFINQSNGGALMATLLPAAEETALASNDEAEESEADAPDVVATDDHSTEVVADTEEETEEVEVAAISTSNGRFHIVAGSFRSQRYANRLKASLESNGADVRILDPVGSSTTYKVSVSSYSSKANAKSDISNMRAKYGSAAWIYNE